MYHLSETKDTMNDSFVIKIPDSAPWAVNQPMKSARTFFKARLRTEKLVPLLELALENVEAFGDTVWEPFQF